MLKCSEGGLWSGNVWFKCILLLFFLSDDLVQIFVSNPISYVQGRRRRPSIATNIAAKHLDTQNWSA